MSNVPTWHDAARCGVLRFPELHRAATDGAAFAAQHGIKKCQQWQDDDSAVVLSVIDCQLDFIHPEAALPVPGAAGDTDRLCRFIYENVGRISHVLGSLDTHYLYQPFHPFNWIAGTNPTTRPNGAAYQQGDHPEPFTIITAKDVREDAWRPLRHPAKMQQYLDKLEQQAKKQLCIWPIHCVLGTPGHAFDPAFAEAMTFHAAARGNQYDATTKGVAQLSEHYGILQAEVQFPEDPSTQLNQRVLSKWEQADRVYFAGQAKSHCVIETLNQVVALFQHQGKNHLLEKLYVLQDCMSSVGDITLPDGSKIEFDKMANERLAELAKLGVKLVNSTDPIAA
jgi:nicotinamidase-related amidase